MQSEDQQLILKNVNLDCCGFSDLSQRISCQNLSNGAERWKLDSENERNFRRLLYTRKIHCCDLNIQILRFMKRLYHQLLLVGRKMPV